MTDRRAAIESLIEARNAKDKAAIEGLLAENAELWQPFSLREEPTRGRDAVASALAGGIGSAFFDLDTMVRTVKRISVDGDVAFVEQHVDAKTSFGNDYSNEYLWIYTFEGDRITRIEEHLDTLRFSRTIKEGRKSVGKGETQ